VTPIETVGVSLPMLVTAVLGAGAMAITCTLWIVRHIDGAVRPIAEDLRALDKRVDHHDQLFAEMGQQVTRRR
jgi:hypothetical protein